MTLGSNFRYSPAIRVVLAMGALSAWLLVPAGLAQYSSSLDYHPLMENLAQDQYPNQGGYSRQGYGMRHQDSTISHIAIEVGGGFNRPVGNTRSFATWGGNFTAGAGWNFSKYFATLAEWQFNSNKIPGPYLANVGVPGGHIHTWGLTLEPTMYLHPQGKLGAYVLGGGGFYRRVTSFTVPVLEESCFYFCEEEEVNETIAHYSSNQGGLNVGAGVTWKAFGEDSKTKLFAEARYVWMNTPTKNFFDTPDGAFATVPISVGLRW